MVVPMARLPPPAADGADVAPRTEVVAVAAEEHAAAIRAMPTATPAR